MAKRNFLSWEKDIRPHFEYFIPSMLVILDPSQSQILQITRRYNERIELNKEMILRNGIFQAQTAFFDLMWQAKDGDKTSIGYAKFIEEICSSLLKPITHLRIKTKNHLLSGYCEFR